MDSKFIEVLELVSQGSSVSRACKAVSDYNKDKFYECLKASDEAKDNYARAIRFRQEVLFDDIVEIADDSIQDTRILEDGREVVNNDVIQRAKLRVDARKWVLSRMNPKKYGDRLNVDHDAENKGNPPNLIWREKPKV